MDLLEMRQILAFLALLGLGLAIGVPPAGAQAPFLASANTVTLAVTGATARTAITVDSYNNAVRLYNSGTVAVFIACGGATVVAATATSLPVAPGTVEVLGCQGGYLAAITGGTAATLYITAGSGI